MLRFEEFSALRRRQTPADSVDMAGAEPTPPTRVDKAGFFFEALEVQMLTLGLITVDLIGSITTMLLTCGSIPQPTMERAILNLLETIMGFTLVYFLMELIALMFAFKISFFFHLGNMTDSIVIAVCLVSEVQGKSRGIRILGLLRSWRLFRLMSTLLKKKDKEIDNAIEGWQEDQELLEKSKVEIARLEDAIRRENDSKKRVEKMLKSYKDEVETLNEALKIAALDIANAAGDQFMLDGEDSDDGSGPSSIPGEPVESETKPESPGGGAKTVFVKNDGSYELRET